MRRKKDAKRPIIEESVKATKIKNKLLKHWDHIDRQITKESLEETASKIHLSIAKNATQRVHLKAKPITLFAENQNTAKISKKISQITDKIKKEIYVPSSHKEG
ncbi:MAG: hypothetical protein ACOVOR_00455 [Rhabdochlamydiaceae bacterium]